MFVRSPISQSPRYVKWADLEPSCIIKWLFFILFYSFINISSPLFLIKYLAEIRNNIKYFGVLEGKDYSLPSNKYHNFSKSEIEWNLFIYFLK